jgi:hypothetical protein
MRVFKTLLWTAATVVFLMAPKWSNAGPCSNDIAELEAAIQWPSAKAVGELDLRSANIQLARRSMPNIDGTLRPGLSATIARAKRLDLHDDRVGCFGALTAARRMYVPMAKQ